MSKAGIQSNRGDGYQTLIAFEWALSILSEASYQWLEIDSVREAVDDVVIGKLDGSKIYCQCKKNQALHKAWSTADLADELRKAITLLTKDPTAEIRFYSRSSFGNLSRLREYSTNFADEETYRTNLGKVLHESDAELANLLTEQASSLSTYQLLKQTTFEISPELDRMESFLRERLRRLVSNSTAAYNTIWTRLDYLGMRVSSHGESSATQHRLTKDDLKALLDDSGSLLTPPIDIFKARTSFKSTSAIGRSWRRDIGNEIVSNPSVEEIIEAIKAKHGSILLTGLPGSGKTCVMLAVQEALEDFVQTRINLLPLFIQSREFADITTAQDRQALGLHEHWVEEAARMAEDAHVVIMIDSLDVLSIAREHTVLTYFLAQIDRLLLVPNITVVAACRDFDCHYDRRIAQRSWSKKITCQPLKWNTEIEPLLVKLSIDISTIDMNTRELICNPRELALFVELAQQGGSFNVVTSQALAQRYLATIVQANSALGDAAMQAIEAMASEMLKLRSLAVPRQRCTASQDIQRSLLSNKVLHETQDGQLTFGHQTLLDVLVISGAIRQAITLNTFIQNLSPVPFVRPSIRSFVKQLTIGDRRELRKQMRTVLTGNNAFHIRRLVAETFAEQSPHDDDWLLIRDMRNQHRDVFQVIYTQATRVEWHYFWMKYLVPFLKDTGEADGLIMHVHRVSQWKNDDPAGVFAFWIEVLALNGVDNTQLTNAIAHAITQVHSDHSAMLVPLLAKLLKLPRQKHSFLGHALARCVKDGYMDDAVLWHYVAGEVTNEDVLAYNFGEKLHCHPHEFGATNENFIAYRMRQSTVFLDLAITSIERWSQIKYSRHGEVPKNFWDGFLYQTSYSDAHNQTNHQHLDDERILLDAVESAIVHQASTQSDWWKSKSEHLCFHTEGALYYFAILACIAAPIANLDVIGRMLCNKKLLESALSYELGTLIQAAFLHLDMATQDAIQSTLLTLHLDTASSPEHIAWALRDQAQLLLTIPCHLRSADAQSVLDECEKEIWPLNRQPKVHIRGGAIYAPFSFEIFLGASNDSVLGLLNHYGAHVSNSFDDFLMGGRREVGSQLREAASRYPSRFMNLLSDNWERISNHFRDDLMAGIATYIAQRYGNLQVNGTWSPQEEPNETTLVQQILSELEAHPSHWHHNRIASKAIESCAYIVELSQDTSRLVSLAVDFATLQEESSISGNSVDLVTIGINMAKGNAAEALMIVANQLEKNGIPWPQLLSNALRLFATDPHPAIRALLLRRMPYLQSHHPEIGWELFGLTMQQKSPGLWPIAESSLYYAYHQNFEIVALWLTHLYREGSNKDLKTWGRISALAALSKRLEFSSFIAEINAGENVEAWCGAASVWTHSKNIQQHQEQCLAGLEAGLYAENYCALAVARKFRSLFQEKTQLVAIPIKLIQRCLLLLGTDADSTPSDIYGFDAWLNAISLRDPIYALKATEIYLDFARQAKLYLCNYEDNFTQLLTRLFAQAEEQEESDAGAMLQRVVATQDSLLTLGLDGINDWLKAAERP
ncbi:ATP-binding protein [Pseudomonas entomophila]|uniref:AAA family ATPase n=1 Tax=Pseudomonas entomophila TaxID=312306 RepID=UPI0015E3F0D1|nr:ATP-binding protein [Pseudomonas entomophila]MBA1188677.1 ATP-binding protein [Pseudomonas entomophila]